MDTNGISNEALGTANCQAKHHKLLCLEKLGCLAGVEDPGSERTCCWGEGSDSAQLLLCFPHRERRGTETGCWSPVSPEMQEF